MIDVRNLGLVAGIELAPRAGAPGTRAYEAFVKCFEMGVLVRTTGDIFALSPPLIIERSHIDQIIDTVQTGASNAVRAIESGQHRSEDQRIEAQEEHVADRRKRIDAEQPVGGMQQVARVN